MPLQHSNTQISTHSSKSTTFFVIHSVPKILLITENSGKLHIHLLHFKNKKHGVESAFQKYVYQNVMCMSVLIIRKLCLKKITISSSGWIFS